MHAHMTQDQAAVLETVDRFLDRECPRETLLRLDEAGGFPEDQYAALSTLGLSGLAVPEDLGGAGPDTMGGALVVSRLAALSPVLAAAFGASCFGARIIDLCGSPAQREHLLPAFAAGEARLCLGLAEPESPYGAGGVTSTVSLNGHGCVVRGAKRDVRLASRMTHLLVSALLDGAPAAVLCTDGEHFTVTPQDTVGCRGLDLSTVHLSGGGELLGGSAAGMDERLQTICAVADLETAALALGLTRGACDYAAAYAGERRQFGRPIIGFGAVRQMIVQSELDIRAGELLLADACRRLDADGDCRAAALMARIHSVRVARRAAMDGVQILGGYGYASEYDAQRYLRDSLALAGGTSSSAELMERLGRTLGIGQLDH